MTSRTVSQADRQLEHDLFHQLVIILANVPSAHHFQGGLEPVELALFAEDQFVVFYRLGLFTGIRIFKHKLSRVGSSGPFCNYPKGKK